MPKYLVQASYSPEGAKGLLKDGGTKRVETVTAAVKALGGTIDGFYYCFGDDDVVGIFDVPDDETAAAFAIAINATGAVKIKTTRLLTAEQIDTATRKTVGYRPPGQ